MLSSVLRSRPAIAVDVQIMRPFVRMRELLASNTALARKLNELEARIQSDIRSVLVVLERTSPARDHCLNFATTRPSRNLTTQAFGIGQTV